MIFAFFFSFILSEQRQTMENIRISDDLVGFGPLNEWMKEETA